MMFFRKIPSNSEIWSSTTWTELFINNLNDFFALRTRRFCNLHCTVLLCITVTDSTETIAMSFTWKCQVMSLKYQELTSYNNGTECAILGGILASAYLKSCSLQSMPVVPNILPMVTHLGTRLWSVRDHKTIMQLNLRKIPFYHFYVWV